jgi:hypothetical protein
MRMTVVIPVRDDVAGLQRALGGLARQTHPAEEILLVNAGDVPLPAGVTTGPPIREVRVGPAMPGGARNAGAAAAKNEWLAFLDAGTEPDPFWLGAFAEAAEATPEVEILFGSYRPRVRDDWDWSAVATYIAPSNTCGGGRFPTTASICLRRETWDRLGGMREDLRAGEDLFFFDTIAALRARTAVVPSAQVVWDLPHGLRGHLDRLRSYSCATWPTSLSHRWQRPVLKMYLAGTLATVASLGLCPPLVGLVGLLAVVRLATNVARRRRDLRLPFSLRRLARVPAMLAIADLGTLLGVADAMLFRPRSST